MLGRTVAELERSMSSAELSEWLAFESAYGLPDGYFVTAQACRTVVGAMTGKETDPGDYVPWFRRDRRKQSAAEMRSIVRAHVAGARVKAGRV